jgi:hypothetical protein
VNSPQHEGYRFLDDIRDVALLMLPQHIVAGDPVIDPNDAHSHHFRGRIRNKPFAKPAADIDKDILDIGCQSDEQILALFLNFLALSDRLPEKDRDLFRIVHAEVPQEGHGDLAETVERLTRFLQLLAQPFS